MLLDAWQEVAQAVPGSELVVVGDGPNRAALERRAMPRVRWPGARDDVPVWLAAADVVVLPSRWEAGASLVAMEAMARCRSVVATDVAGMRDVVEPGAGQVVAIEDRRSLAAAVARRLKDPSLVRAEGIIGRARIEERYSVDRVNEQFFELYETVLSERRERHANR